MIYLFYPILGLCLIVFQTAVKPFLPSFLAGFYDLLVPLVVYLSMCRPPREYLPNILLWGFVMDSLSGAPFGLYVSAYLWIVFSIQGVMRLFHMRNRLVLWPMVALGVLLENLIVIGLKAAFIPASLNLQEITVLLAPQLVWALGTGAVFLYLLKSTDAALSRWRSEYYEPAD